MNIQEMLGKVQEMKQKMQDAQDNLKHIQIEGEAGAGMVKATVNGLKRVIKLHIDSSLLNPDDKEMTADLIVAAVNKALENVEEKNQEELRKTMADVLPNIPGLNLF